MTLLNKRHLSLCLCPIIWNWRGCSKLITGKYKANEQLYCFGEPAWQGQVLPCVCTLKGVELLYWWEMGESGEASANLMPLAAFWSLQMKAINMYFNSMAAKCFSPSSRLLGARCLMPLMIQKQLTWCGKSKFFFFWYTTILFLMVNPLGWLLAVTLLGQVGFNPFFSQAVSEYIKIVAHCLHRYLIDRLSTPMWFF